MSTSTVATGMPLPWHGKASTSLTEAEFHALYLELSRPLLAYLRGVTGRPDLAEDLLQETFCRFLSRRPPAMALEETRRYLFRVATNLLRDRWRRGDDLPAPEPEECGRGPGLDLQLDVHRAMEALKPRERELLWLAYVEGMSHLEIAAITGVSRLSVRLLLFRARGRAAALLAPSHKPAASEASGPSRKRP